MTATQIRTLAYAEGLTISQIQRRLLKAGQRIGKGRLWQIIVMGKEN